MINNNEDTRWSYASKLLIQLKRIFEFKIGIKDKKNKAERQEVSNAKSK